MALIAQLREHCTGIAEVVGSNPAQSEPEFFSGLCSSSITAALALMTNNDNDNNNNTKNNINTVIYNQIFTQDSPSVQSTVINGVLLT